MEYYFSQKKKDVKTMFNNALYDALKRNLLRGSTAMDIFTSSNKKFIENINKELCEKLSASKAYSVFKEHDKVYKKNITEIHYSIIEQLNELLPKHIRNKNEQEFIYKQLEENIKDSIEEWNNIAKHKRQPLIEKLKNASIIIGLLGGFPFICNKVFALWNIIKHFWSYNSM